MNVAEAKRVVIAESLQSDRMVEGCRVSVEEAGEDCKRPREFLYSLPATDFL